MHMIFVFLCIFLPVALYIRKVQKQFCLSVSGYIEWLEGLSRPHLQLIQSMAYRATVNLRVLAGVAKPNPKMGQSLGPLGINMMKFCEQFNKVTTHIRPDVPMKVKLTAFTDRTFKFKIKPPETSWFLRKAAGQEKFTALPGHYNFVEVPVQYVYEIAKVKKELDPDFKNYDVATIMTMIQGQMYTMGLMTTDEVNIPEPISIRMKI